MSTLQLSVEYLDWRRLPTQQNQDQVEKLLQIRYGTSRPDVLIVTDDPALEFALDHRNGLFADMPIVFCGVNDYEASVLREDDDITGVAEEIDPAGTLALALRLHSVAASVYVITDFTETGLAVRRTIQSVIPAFEDRASFTFSPDVTITELMDATAALPDGTIILAGPFTRDKDGTFIDMPAFTAELARHTSLPIYGVYEQCLGWGIVGGVLTSPQLEGTKAAELVARILTGEPAGSIPVVTRQSTHVAFDWRKVSALGIPMSSLPVGATVVNRPVTILDTNRRLVVFTAVIILLLVLGIVFLAVNDVRRERAEASARRLATAIEQTAEAIAITDPTGVVTYVNPAFEHTTGFRDAESRGHNIRALLGEEVAAPLERRVEESLTPYESWKKKITRIRKDGSLVELDLTVSPVRGRDDEVSNYTYVARDITQEAALEEQLRQSQKMEGIGLLAGGIAHDFNNILTGILGYANMLEPDAAPGSTMQEGLHVIQQAAERAAELTKQLLSFARRGKRQNITVDLNSTILEVVSLLHADGRQEHHHDRALRYQPGNCPGRSRAASASGAQPGNQRARCDATGRDPDVPDVAPAVRRRTAGGASRGKAWRVRRSLCRRLRCRHREEEPPPHLRTLLHDKGHGKRDGHGAGHGLWHRQESQRVHRCHKRRGQGCCLHRIYPRDRPCACGRTAFQSSTQRDMDASWSSMTKKSSASWHERCCAGRVMTSSLSPA